MPPLESLIICNPKFQLGYHMTVNAQLLPATLLLVPPAVLSLYLLLVEA